MNNANDVKSDEASLADLLRKVTEQSTELARKEVQLAKAELELKAKQAGRGFGAFGAAGMIAGLAAGALTATFILALAEAVDAWLAALIVTVAYLAIAGILALAGRQKLREATPPLPEKAIESTGDDVTEIRESVKAGVNR